jgi:hypothetical protein
MTPTCRPRDHLLAAARLYPRAWTEFDRMRDGRSPSLHWPDWCFLPIAGALAAAATDAGVDVSHLGRLYPERVADAARLAALGAVASGQAALGAVTSSFSSPEDARVEPAITEAVFEAVSGAAGGSTRVFRLAAGALSAAARAQAEPDVATAAILQAVRRLKR